MEVKRKYYKKKFQKIFIPTEIQNNFLPHPLSKMEAPIGIISIEYKKIYRFLLAKFRRYKSEKKKKCVKNHIKSEGPERDPFRTFS